MTFPRSDLKSDDEHGLTVIAVDGDKNSQCAVKWAMDNLVNRKSPDNCILIHVQCKTVNLGDHPVNSVSKEGRPPTQQELQQFFLPYRGFCARRGIETKEVVLHGHDAPSALIGYISHNNIANIVVGASHRNAITRKFRHADTPSSLLKSAPESCAVYVIAKGKVQTSRSAKSRSHTPIHTPTNSTSPANSNSNVCWQNLPENSSSDSNFSNGSRGNRKPNLWEQRRLPKDSLPSVDVSQISFTESWKSDDKTSSSDKSISNDKLSFGFKGISHQRSPHGHAPALFDGISIAVASESSGTPSVPSSNISYENFDFSNASGHNSSQLRTLLDAEMRRLKLELQQSMLLFNSVTKEANFAKQMVRELQRLQTLEACKLECVKSTEDAAHSIAEMKKQKAIIALEAVRAVQRAAEAEKKKNGVEDHHEADGKPTITVAPAADDLRCRRYTIQEIEIATDHFSPANKVGEGGYGPVYKGTLDHISVAIKILRPDLSQGQKQFRQEIDVLSRMRHPYMVILLGACPEYGCLVYEYMENGSLEDRLFRKGNTPPISWRNRFRIAYEIATALLFLHGTKPEPLVHRDLKPANILLDFNYVSKISDVGLARLLPQSPCNNVSQYRMTAAAGTFYYIDPEYQQTGLLGVKSDIYSFGVVLLQLLTARPPVGLAYQVQEAIEKGTFSHILDQSIASWPVNEALLIAKLAVQCCEMRKKDRPDLASVIWPELKKLRDLAMIHDAPEQKTILALPSPDDLTSDHSNVSEVSNYFRRMNVHL